MGHFRALRAWQEARRLAVLSSHAIEKLPPHERPGLGDQWRRASYSVALNLAEGATRRSTKEFRRFVGIARGSLDELDAIFAIVEGLAYLEPERRTELQRVRDNCSRMVSGLLKKLDTMVGPNS
jgi:four helix bundle protein